MIKTYLIIHLVYLRPPERELELDDLEELEPEDLEELEPDDLVELWDDPE